MKIFAKYLILLVLLLLNVTCKKDTIVEPIAPVVPPASVLPLLTNLPSKNITATSILLQGLIDLHGNSSATIYFEYGPTTSYGSKSPDQIVMTSDTISAAIINLNPGTLYHWRIYCITTKDIINSVDTYFTTNPESPILTALPPENNTDESIKFNWQIDLRGSSYANVSIEYGVSTYYGFKSATQKVTSSGNFFTTLNNLAHGTTYHWRIVGITSFGNYFSSDNVVSTKFKFYYPLEIGKTWTYKYSYLRNYISFTNPPSEVRSGLRIWEIVSSNSQGDSTIYNLNCTARDTVWLGGVMSFEEQLVPFTIVVTPFEIKVNFENTVKAVTVWANPILPLPRYFSENIIQVANGNSIYQSGTGLYSYGISHIGNTTVIESLDLLY